MIATTISQRSFLKSSILNSISDGIFTISNPFATLNFQGFGYDAALPGVAALKQAEQTSNDLPPK